MHQENHSLLSDELQQVAAPPSPVYPCTRCVQESMHIAEMCPAAPAWSVPDLHLQRQSGVRFLLTTPP